MVNVTKGLLRMQSSLGEGFTSTKGEIDMMGSGETTNPMATAPTYSKVVKL